MSEALATTGTTPAAPAAPVAVVPAVVRSRRATIALRTVRVLLALVYGVAAGLPKLLGDPTARQGFAEMGFDAWFMQVVGALEILGATALLIPLLSGVSALALGALMAGATVATALSAGGVAWLVPLAMLLPLGYVARAQRQQTLRLVRLARRPGVTRSGAAR